MPQRWGWGQCPRHLPGPWSPQGHPPVPWHFLLGSPPSPHGGPSRAHAPVYGHTHGPTPLIPGGTWSETVSRNPLLAPIPKCLFHTKWPSPGPSGAGRGGGAPSGTGHPPAAPGGAGHTGALVRTRAGLRSLDLPREGARRSLDGAGGTNNPFPGAGCGVWAAGSGLSTRPPRGVQRPRRGPGARSERRASGIHLLLQLGPAERSG